MVKRNMSGMTKTVKYSQMCELLGKLPREFATISGLQHRKSNAEKLIIYQEHISRNAVSCESYIAASGKSFASITKLLASQFYVLILRHKQNMLNVASIKPLPIHNEHFEKAYSKRKRNNKADKKRVQIIRHLHAKLE